MKVEKGAAPAAKAPRRGNVGRLRTKNVTALLLMAAMLFALVKANPGIHFDVDLEAQEVKAGEKTYRFTIDAFRRHCMMNGLDSIGLTSQHDDAIAAYEAKQPAFMR